MLTDVTRMLRLIVVVALLACVLAKPATAPIQCGVIGDAEYCERSVCYVIHVNDTCGWLNVSDTPAPACDAAYYASFVASLGESLFVLYESPEREANGYPTMREALDWTGSVKPLTDCTIVNGTAYSEVGKASSGNGGGNDKYTKAILIIVVIVVGLILLLAAAIVAIIAVALVVRHYKKSAVTL